MEIQNWHKLTQEQRDEYGKNISLENVYDKNGNLLTLKTFDGCWFECTYDKNSNRLTHKNYNGHWFKKTYDKHGVLTNRTSRNPDVLYKRIAYDKRYALLVHDNSVVAGCRRLSLAEALEHWGNNRGGCSKRAKLFYDTLVKYKKNLNKKA